MAPVTLEAIHDVRERIAGTIFRTPLVPLNFASSPNAQHPTPNTQHRTPNTAVFLKLETLQPIGSFKLRGAANRILQASPEETGTYPPNPLPSR